jgi:hypothetical protein
MAKDGAVFVLNTNGGEQKVQLNGGLPSNKYVVRWVQYTGANYPTDTVLYIIGYSENGLDFGTSTVTTGAITTKALAIPLTSATGAFVFGWPVECINRNVNGQYNLKQGRDVNWTFRVMSNSSSTPTFTSLTVCIESI